jgi:hypothetical protein
MAEVSVETDPNLSPTRMAGCAPERAARLPVHLMWSRPFSCGTTFVTLGFRGEVSKTSLAFFQGGMEEIPHPKNLRGLVL